MNMIVYVNGEQESWQKARTVEAWLQDIGLLGKRVAVELNGQILPKSQFTQYQVQNNDRLEVIAAVGGG